MTEKVKLLVFHAPKWCGPCQGMKKSGAVEKFAAKHAEVEVVHVDVDDEEELSEDYKVANLPTLVFEDEDGEELHRHESAVSALMLERIYQKMLNESDTEDST